MPCVSIADNASDPDSIIEEATNHAVTEISECYAEKALYQPYNASQAIATEWYDQTDMRRMCFYRNCSVPGGSHGTGSCLPSVNNTNLEWVFSHSGHYGLCGGYPTVVCLCYHDHAR